MLESQFTSDGSYSIEILVKHSIGKGQTQIITTRIHYDSNQIIINIFVWKYC